jgi:hypothetical protein
MMKRGWVTLALFGLSACDRGATPLIAYRHAGDAMARVLPLGVFDIYPCASRQKIQGTDVIVGVPFDQCYKMLPPKRYRGVWLDEFEGSAFFEGARGAGEVRAAIARRSDAWPSSQVWLDWPENGGATALPTKTSANARLVVMDFVGRRTVYAGSYGHMGGSQHEILVDRMLSAKPIYQSPLPYLEDEIRPK